MVALDARTAKFDHPILVELLISIRWKAERGALESFHVNSNPACLGVSTTNCGSKMILDATTGFVSMGTREGTKQNCLSFVPLASAQLETIGPLSPLTR
jgi:hypothetical protein